MHKGAQRGCCAPFLLFPVEGQARFPPSPSPLRAFFVLEQPRRKEDTPEYQAVASQCPYGHFLFWNAVFRKIETGLLRQVAMPLRAFFVLEQRAILFFGGARWTGVAMPLRAFFVLELSLCYAPFSFVLSRRNALTGIFCFGTRGGVPMRKNRKSKSQCPYGHFLFWNLLKPRVVWVCGRVAMPLRAFFVLERPGFQCAPSRT